MNQTPTSRGKSSEETPVQYFHTSKALKSPVRGTKHPYAWPTFLVVSPNETPPQPLKDLPWPKSPLDKGDPQKDLQLEKELFFLTLPVNPYQYWF